MKEPVLGHPLPQHVLGCVAIRCYYPVIQWLDALARVFIDDGEWIITCVETDSQRRHFRVLDHVANGPRTLLAEESLSTVGPSLPSKLCKLECPAQGQRTAVAREAVQCGGRAWALEPICLGSQSASATC